MKDYEVNYVHQESKTIPDANYTFETSTKPAPCKCSDFIKTQTPPTVKDVLLKTWAQDTRVMALSRVHLDTPSGECTVDHEGRTVYYQSFEEALDGEIAYLNSAAEQKGATK